MNNEEELPKIPKPCPSCAGREMHSISFFLGFRIFHQYHEFNETSNLL
ncbi:MAG: hypothetical protein ACTSVX_02145 [Promethearchaeota archaeon]